MSTIVTRAGKGSPLTNTEVDSNFTNLNTDKYQAGGALGTPASGNLTNCTDLPQAGVVNLTTDLAAKAPLASPSFTGTPLAPTAAVDTNTTQLATTAFVIGQAYLKSATASSTYVALTGDQTIAGTKTFSSTITGSISGNAGTVTNGVYTTGTQTVGGDKTFTGSNRLQGNQLIGANEVLLYEGTTNAFTIRTGASGAYKYMGIAANGDMTIQGNFTASGNVTAYSDERLKENIQLIPDALAKVESVRGVVFTRKEDGVAGMGVIAQEIRKVAPEVIMIDEHGMMSVAYGNLVGLLIEAVKDLSGKVKQLQAKVG